MFMYHSWGSQNAWLRQHTARNYLYLHPGTRARHGIADEDWITVTSHHGSIPVQAKFASKMQPDTVWRWNALGQRRRAWRMRPAACRGRKTGYMTCSTRWASVSIKTHHNHNK